MKFLLTSGGVKNASINHALEELLGKPVTESNAICIATASYAFPGGAAAAWRVIAGRSNNPMTDLGWKSLGLLELTALPSMAAEHWVPMLQESDALLVGGGDSLYLCYWMRKSGMADLLPSLPLVYLGVSAGSMVVTPSFGVAYDGWFCRDAPRPANDRPVADDRALGLVGFSVFPHVDNPRSPDNSMANAEKWSATVPVPTYAIDDETAIRVVDSAVDVVSEGHWRLFSR